MLFYIAASVIEYAVVNEFIIVGNSATIAMSGSTKNTTVSTIVIFRDMALAFASFTRISIFCSIIVRRCSVETVSIEFGSINKL